MAKALEDDLVDEVGESRAERSGGPLKDESRDLQDAQEDDPAQLMPLVCDEVPTAVHDDLEDFKKDTADMCDQLELIPSGHAGPRRVSPL